MTVVLLRHYNRQYRKVLYRMIEKARILLALENKETNELVCTALGKFAKYVVETADNAEAVYAAIHTFQPDLTLVDYALKIVNPIELHEGVELLHPGTKFVICVTDENLKVAQCIWNKRSIDYVRKPIDPDRIVDEVNKIMRHIFDVREIAALRKRVATLEDENERLKKLL